jgi:hypothetical protein
MISEPVANVMALAALLLVAMVVSGGRCAF